jgi:hypothetical protein
VIKGAHLAALGLLLGSIATSVSTLPDWSHATKPVFIAAVLLSVGSTLTALFSDKPRSAEAQDRRTDR